MENKIALITGASRGIGEAILTSLGKQGVITIGTATTNKGALAITQKLKDNNIKGIGLKLDVCDNTDIKKVITSIQDKFGEVDILINNAGITNDNLLMRMQESEWENVIQTNLTSVYRMTKAILRGMMKKKSGRIISISSVVGSMGNAGQVNYCAAKAGIVGFTKSLAREVGSRGITVNAIAPGFIKTAMTDALPEEQKQNLAKQIPLGKLGTVDDIAKMVVFLVSDGGDYITAQTLHINGGMYTV